MRTRIFAGAMLVGTCVAALAQAQSAPPDAHADTARIQARDGFNRALRLAGENDNAAALAEFKRVYELAPNPLVLFNIGLVYAALGRPVEAVQALDKLLAAPGSVSADRVAKARVLREDQAARIANIEVTVNVEQASIEVDGLEVAKTPLTAPLAVSGGTHVVGAVAAGHAPSRKEVTVAGRATAKVALELAPMVGHLAHLAIHSHLPGASVVIDGTPAGRTPLAASITLSPGAHRVELMRPGYVTARRDVELGDGASGEIAIELEEDRGTLDADMGTLALGISQKQALITVDGRARGVYLGSLHLARGVHQLRVERGGFLSVERDVDLAPGTITTLPVDLYPAADTLADYTANGRFHRTWGIVGVIAGALIGGAAAGVFIHDASQRSTAKSQITTLESGLAQGSHPCASTDPPDQCNAAINAAYASYQSARDRDAAGYVIGGVGVVAVAVGIALLVTGDDPHRYEQKRDGQPFANVHVLPTAWQSARGGNIGLEGTF